MLNYRKQDDEIYYEYYTIKRGDNLYQIAKNYNVNPSLLAALNGLDLNEFIYPNQVIMVPKKEFSYYITKDGDTLALVANTFETVITSSPVPVTIDSAVESVAVTAKLPA